MFIFKFLLSCELNKKRHVLNGAARKTRARYTFNKKLKALLISSNKITPSYYCSTPATVCSKSEPISPVLNQLFQGLYTSTLESNQLFWNSFAQCQSFFFNSLYRVKATPSRTPNHTAPSTVDLPGETGTYSLNTVWHHRLSQSYKDDRNDGYWMTH